MGFKELTDRQTHAHWEPEAPQLHETGIPEPQNLPGPTLCISSSVYSCVYSIVAFNKMANVFP